VEGIDEGVEDEADDTAVVVVGVLAHAVTLGLAGVPAEVEVPLVVGRTNTTLLATVDLIRPGSNGSSGPLLVHGWGSLLAFLLVHDGGGVTGAIRTLLDVDEVLEAVTGTDSRSEGHGDLLKQIPGSGLVSHANGLNGSGLKSTDG